VGCTLDAKQKKGREVDEGERERARARERRERRDREKKRERERESVSESKSRKKKNLDWPLSNAPAMDSQLSRRRAYWSRAHVLGHILVGAWGGGRAGKGSFVRSGRGEWGP
jgi:septal ring factor EnvC (AmiA/AmiB activator)